MLPDSIPTSLWDEFRKHRIALKAKMTPHAETLILCKLEKWRVESGANPIDVLNESIEKGWKGVFLNGHGRLVSGASATNVTEPVLPVCCECKGSLQGGFIFTSKGRRCHSCP